MVAGILLVSDLVLFPAVRGGLWIWWFCVIRGDLVFLGVVLMFGLI